VPVDRSWSLTLLRALPAAVVALVITFSADHSAYLGLIVLGSFAVFSGVIIIAGAVRGAYPRASFGVQGSLLILGGTVALVFNDAGLPLLLVLTSVLLGATGIIELVAGLRARGRLAGARDWVFVGGITALAAVAVLLVPADFVDVISVPGKDVPPLTASIMVVGLFGAYAAIVAVYLVIAGLSLKWAPQASAPSVSEA
jgi:uncharacterized membrane protein HdeD (DUF308 family)